MKKKHILIIIFFILCLYLLINTGIFSDEFGIIYEIRNKNMKDLLDINKNSYFLETPLEHYTHYIWYRFFNVDNQVLINMLKMFYIIISFYFISQFFRIYLDTYTSFWASFLFLFFPTHDSTVYCFMGQYLTLSFAFYLYAFYLAKKNKLLPAFILALMGSFICYGSTPIALALFILFILDKECKKGACLLIPNIIYAIFFIPLNIVMRMGSPRIIEKLSLGAALKQFILQILTFIDSCFGPSMWLKIYYSFTQLSPLSLLIATLLTIIFYRTAQENLAKYDKKLIISFLVLLFSSFVIFAFTGRYPQMAFNLGNRVTIFGALLVSYLLILMPLNKKVRTIIFGLLIFSILGISDHWKAWNLQQQRVIKNIQNNRDLKKYSENRTIYVSGNQYSKYGPLGHIEFLSEDWVPRSVLSLVFDRDIPAKSLNKRYEYKDGFLIDTKYARKTQVTDYVNIYDSEKDVFFKLSADKINSYIDSLPQDYRHWVQALDIKLLKGIAVRLMPRLGYAR